MSTTAAIEYEPLTVMPYAEGHSLIACTSDFHYGTSHAIDVANLIQRNGVDCIVTSGDQMTKDNFATVCDVIYQDWVAREKLFPVPGNHDWRNLAQTVDDGLTAYLAAFTWLKDQYYYTLRVGPIEFFMVSSDSLTPDGRAVGSVQQEWLVDAAARSDASWKIGVSHHAPYSSSPVHGSDMTMRATWATVEMDMIINGHDHFWERLVYGDTTYIINGSGGSTLYNFAATPLSGSLVRYNTEHGAMFIEATPNKMHCRFINTDDVVIDEFQFDK